MGSLQYVWYQYKLTENMPSENAIGQQLSASQVASLNLTQEGAIGDKFYMKDNSATTRWFEFNLVREDRSRGFLQPKIGINYNATPNLNIFGNFAHVERFVDLGVYYNQGRVNPNVEDEKSNQFELGLGWNSDYLYAKLNGYYMLWDNKSSYITDQSKAGEPGYDRNGNRSELIGTSRHMGVELELGLPLDNIIKVNGFGLRGSLTYMDNTWQSVLDNVKIDPITGLRRSFNASALDENGNKYIQYFDELEGKHVASGPQFMSSLSLLYDNYGVFGSLDFSFFARDYMLDGDTYAAIDGEWVGTDTKGRDLFKSEFDNQLPSRGILDFNVGYNFNFGKQLPLKGVVSFQVLNILDTDFLSSSDRFGVIPGLKRTFRGTLSIGW